MDDKNPKSRTETFSNPEEAVKEGINRFIGIFNERNFKKFGLGNSLPDDLTIGTDYLKVYFIRHDTISKFDIADSPMDLLIDLNERIYPIINENEVISSVTIRQKINSEWEIKNIGDTRLIKEASTLMKGLGNETNFFIVSIPSLYYVFLAYKDDNQHLKLRQLGTAIEDHHKLSKDIHSKDTLEILSIVKAEAMNNTFPLTEEDR